MMIVVWIEEEVVVGCIFILEEDFGINWIVVCFDSIVFVSLDDFGLDESEIESLWLCDVFFEICENCFYIIWDVFKLFK